VIIMSGGRKRIWVWIDTSNSREAEAFVTWRKMAEVLSDSVRARIMSEIVVSGLEGVAQKVRATQLAGGTGLDGLAGISLGDLPLHSAAADEAGSHRRARPSGERRENAEGEVAGQPELEATAPAGPTSAHEADQNLGDTAAVGPTEPPVHEPAQSIEPQGSPPAQPQGQPSPQAYGEDTVIEKAAVESASNVGPAATPEPHLAAISAVPIPTALPVVSAAELAPQVELDASRKTRPKLAMW
jgi:hypothetical protein